MAKAFLDTNVVVYASDADSGSKRETALGVLEHALSSGSGVISTQVCVEFAAAALKKLKLPVDVIHRQLSALDALEIVPVDSTLVQTGLILMQAYRVSYWGSLILAAAEAARCNELYTEDLNTGQLYGSVRAVNPFE